LASSAQFLLLTLKLLSAHTDSSFIAHMFTSCRCVADLVPPEERAGERCQAHDLSLAFFESLYFIEQSRDGSLRVGDLARALRITVGATSKLIDRIEAAGLLRRELDADDRRASRVALADAGTRTLADASTTYEAEMATVLDATLSTDEQRRLHASSRACSPQPMMEKSHDDHDARCRAGGPGTRGSTPDT
jgi:DNA-binding MarR family transcriptional regulator